ncbi:unnamed protein product [Ectocarpus sp. CCAP 1310/34]|nr:unnamed protein product [Ectocarpus sp. CCAP 1310/34]
MNVCTSSTTSGASSSTSTSRRPTMSGTRKSGGTVQGTQGQRVVAERGQPVVAQMRSTSRENCTIITTINAAGAVLAPTFIFKGQRFNGDWVADLNGPPGAFNDCTESSFMCGEVFIKYIKNFHKQLGDRNLLDGKPHVLVLDGHTSHVSLDVIKLVISLNIHLVQLPSHMSHITQPLDVAGFGCFKKELATVIQAFPARNGGALPRKRDMAGNQPSFLRRGGLVAGVQGAGTQPAAAPEEEGDGNRPLSPGGRPHRRDQRTSGGVDRRPRRPRAQGKRPCQHGTSRVSSASATVAATV